MKLSKATISILKNASSINTGIVIHPGSTIQALSPLGNIFLEAEIDETFDNTLAVFDLPEFLSVVELLSTEDSTPELQVDEKTIKLVGQRGEALFVQSDVNQIKHRPAGSKISEFTSVSEFVLTPDLISTIKATSTLPYVVFESVNSKVDLKVKNIKDPSTTVLNFSVGEGTKDFSAVCKSEPFCKLLKTEDGYNVSVTEKLVNLSSKDSKVKYWISLEIESKF